MKILLIHNKYKQEGGEDVVFESEASLLSANGHEVKKIYFSNHDINSPLEALMAGLQASFNPQSYSIIQKVITDFLPDLAHVHNFFPLASPSIFFALKKKNIPIVLTLHNYRLVCSNAHLFRDGKVCEECINKIIPLNGIIHKCYRNSSLQSGVVTLMSSVHKIIGTWKNYIDKYIVMTEFAKNKFANSSLKLPREKLVVKPNFIYETGVGMDVRENNFLFIGRLTEEKGIKLLMEAARAYSFNLIIVGDGSLKDYVIENIKDKLNIQYLGFQDKARVINLLKNTKALIFPSKSYEGLPMTIVEAFATGTPVIASDVGSMKEIVIDNSNGLHFKSGSVESLIERIKWFDSNPFLVQSFYSEARKSYLEKYTDKENYTALMNIYKSVIKSH